MDILQREGHYPLPPQAPKTLGVEFSGVVEKLAPGVEGFKEDDEVFGLAYGGTWICQIVYPAALMLMNHGSSQVLMQSTSLSQQKCVSTSLQNSHLKRLQVFQRYFDVHYLHHATQQLQGYEGNRTASYLGLDHCSPSSICRRRVQEGSKRKPPPLTYIS